jgi:SAM-dependent methyltransferase
MEQCYIGTVYDVPLVHWCPTQINLSPDKAGVLREAYRVLAPGGEMYFSDIYCDRRLPDAVSQLHSTCCPDYKHSCNMGPIFREAALSWQPRCSSTSCHCLKQHCLNHPWGAGQREG